MTPNNDALADELVRQVGEIAESLDATDGETLMAELTETVAFYRRAKPHDAAELYRRLVRVSAIGLTLAATAKGIEIERGRD